MTVLAIEPDLTGVPPGPLVLGVSGGADSTALLVGLAETTQRPLVVAHVDHGLRPESAEEAAFVADLAERIRRGRQAAVHWAPLHIDLAQRARRVSGGLETAGREARYAWFAWLARRWSAAAVCTGHHADDMAETVVANVLRGCGQLGLAGIPRLRHDRRSRSVVCRPLLAYTHADVCAWLDQRGQGWCEDPSNADPTVAPRNRIRQVVLPLWERHCPGVGAELAQRARVTQAELTQPDPFWSVSAEGGEVTFAALPNSPTERGLGWRALLGELGIPLHRQHIADLEAMIERPLGYCWDRGVWRLRRGSHGLIIEPRTEHAPLAAVSVVSPGRTMVNASQCVVTQVVPAPLAPASTPTCAWLAAAGVIGSLTWRGVQAGERWQAFGSPGSRPLRRWLADHGVSRFRRAALGVLADAHGVLWIPGYTIAERARVGSGESAWKCSLEPALRSDLGPQACSV